MERVSVVGAPRLSCAQKNRRRHLFIINRSPLEDCSGRSCRGAHTFCCRKIHSAEIIAISKAYPRGPCGCSTHIIYIYFCLVVPAAAHHSLQSRRAAPATFYTDIVISLADAMYRVTTRADDSTCGVEYRHLIRTVPVIFFTHLSRKNLIPEILESTRTSSCNFAHSRNSA